MHCDFYGHRTSAPGQKFILVMFLDSEHNASLPAVYSAVIFECQKLTVPGMATISTIKHSIMDNLTSSDLQITGAGRSKFEPL